MLALAGVCGLDDVVPVELTVLTLYFAKVVQQLQIPILFIKLNPQSSVIWNPLIYVMTNAAVSVSFVSRSTFDVGTFSVSSSLCQISPRKTSEVFQTKSEK